MRLKYIIDIGKDIKVKHSNNTIQNITNDSERIEYYRLGYYISKSCSTNETGSGTWGTWKAQISCWIAEHGYDLGTDNDATKTGVFHERYPGYASPLYNEAQNKAKEVLSQKSGKFTTTSKGGEGQPQRIEYDGMHTFIGPYNLTHEDGKIEGQAVITTKEGKQIKTSLYSTDGKNVQQLSSLGNYTGNNFYIVYQGEVESVENIKLTSKLKQNIIRARIVLGEPLYSANQSIAIFHGSDSMETEVITEVTLPGVAESRLNIKKVNSVTKKAIPNIGLVLYSEEAKGYVNTNNSTSQRYVSDIKNAEVFRTDKNGEVSINKLTKKGKYIIYEVIHPDAFKNGFEEVSLEKPLNVYELTLNAVGSTEKITINNIQKYIRLSGLVWEDKIEVTKTSVRNDRYKSGEKDNEDKLVNNVIVRLKDSNGNTIQEVKTGGTITYTRLNNGVEKIEEERLAEGTYKFYKIEIDKINQYYVEFIYNGLSYQCVKLVDLNATNTSKAAEGNKRQSFNNKFKVITNNNANGDAGNLSLKYDKPKDYVSTLNYEGTYQYGYNGAEYPINGIADKYIINSTTYSAYNGYLNKIKTAEQIRREEVQELDHIDLGVYKREQPNLSVAKDIDNVKLTVNDRAQVYQYKKFINPNDETNGEYGDSYNIGVKFGQTVGSMRYRRAIYKADTVFESPDKDRELKVYLTYVIGIKNNSNNLSAQVNEIVDFYDSRYEEGSIVVGTDVDANANVINTLNYTKLGRYNQDYSKIAIDTSSLGKIPKQTTRKIYVQFKFSRQAVIDIINNRETLDNVTEITSYSIFDGNTVYAGIDQFSNPGNAQPGNKTTYEADTAYAPSLLLEYSTPRMMSGKIFEDTAIQSLLNSDNIREGNGKFDNGESGIPNVKVELVMKEVDEQTRNYNKWRVIQTVEATGTDGEYSFRDFPAGDYEVRFIWGDEKYTVQSYKATIYNEAKHNNSKWYQDLTDRLSDATDNYQTRLKIDEELKNIKYNIQYKYNEKMTSTTPEMAIDIENTPNRELIQENVGSTEHVYHIQYVDFGIIERPIQRVELGKAIKHVKVALANGQVIVDTDIDEKGKPAQGGIRTNFTAEKGAEGTKDPGFAKVEMDNEVIQGSKLEIEYEITVKNTSERDYVDERFYKVGRSAIRSGIETVKLRATKIVDYLDKGLAVNENEETYVKTAWEKKEKEELRDNDLVAKNVYTGEETKIKDRTILYTEKTASTWLEAGQQILEPLRLKASKVLTTISGESEVELENEAEIIEIQKNGGGKIKSSTPGNYVPGSGKKVEPDDDKAQTIIVTPTTGANLNYTTIGILGIVIATIATLGIILIKRKALGEK